MKTSEIRSLFLDYFAGHGHRVVPGSSLVPGDDPSLLFTNAGMVQFKDVFLGVEQRDYTRAVTAQRCVRAGGKHNDLENVGYTARHHTFFEMLGNFSFGDYFKREAIHYAWDLLTEKIGLPRERLWVTVFEEDDEAADIWLEQVGVAAERFARIGAKDNFWAMGDTGPCGPCTEVFFDHGPQVQGGPPGSPDEDGDRYVEIWNLVFIQFNRLADGALKPLPKPSVDTGLGLERLAAILQNVHGNYEIDLFARLIEAAANVLGRDHRESKSLRVLSDHIRSSSFLVADGVAPSNEGRGYVLRRIIRRAIRHGYRLGAREPFFHRLVAPLCEEMGEAYPELERARDVVERTLEAEEQRFFETLDQGIRILDGEIERLRGSTIPGATVFRLYDTYGFPADLTNDIAREHGLSIDEAGFDAAMEAQRRRAREASRFAMDDTLAVGQAAPTRFRGYEGTESEGRVIALFRDGRETASLEAGARGVVVLDQTPFYAQSGGQVGDRGRMTGSNATFEVDDTRYLANKVVGHHGTLRLGALRVGDALKLGVDAGARAATANNHSATHLVHEALKRVLGARVQQKGSLVEAERLRFDFSHFEPVSARQLRDVEDLVNREIRANHAVETRVMALEDARAAGAAALFGEKYEERVRVVRMGGFSLELCGGTHVARTGDIGLFKLVSETGIAAGVRRIEALTGDAAWAWVRDRLDVADELAARFRLPVEELPARLGQLNKRNRALEEQVRQLQAQLATAAGGSDPDAEVPRIGDVRMVVSRHDDVDAKGMRTLMDRFRSRFERAAILIGGVAGGKVLLVAGTCGEVPGVHCGEIVRAVSEVVDGKGGGRADMAQGGGGATDRIDAALERGAALIAGKLREGA